MPLFGPNVRKMKEKGDVEGLIKELNNKDSNARIEAVRALRDLNHVQGLTEGLKNDDPQVRVESAEALKDIGSSTAMESLAKILVKTLKFGSKDDKIEALVIMQGHGVSYFWVDSKIRARIQKKLPLDLIRSALLEVAETDSYPLVRWHALVALAELGERNDKILSQLIETSERLMAALDNYGLAAFGIRTETLRALSFFRNNHAAVNAVVNALKGSVLVHKRYEEAGPFKEEFYALGALGDPSTRELLEFWATRGVTPGKEHIQKSAQVALELFGIATFDEVERIAESKQRKGVRV